jgi:hypothetical protein
MMIKVLGDIFRVILNNVNHNEVSGGCNIVRESIKAFRPTTVETTMLIDVLAYDGFPAMATLQDTGY